MASEAEDEMKVDSHAALSKHKHGNKQTSAGRFRGERISRRAKPHKSYREDNSDEEFRIDEKNCVKAKGMCCSKSRTVSFWPELSVLFFIGACYRVINNSEAC